MRLDNRWPLIVFFVYSAALVGAYLFYVPSWGLQDDLQSLGIARSVWGSGDFWKSLWSVIMSDLASWGIFRPVYYLGVAVFYHFFANTPWLIYILIALFNLGAVVLWGLVITRIFSVKENRMITSIFLFPLSFFFFTPFWNIFVHISFQEKYIVFFSAGALYFLERAYRREKVLYLLAVMGAMILGILSKPTGIHLTMACIVFAVLDIFLLKYKKNISVWVLSLNMVLFVLYYWFITTNLRGYAGQYSLTFATVMNNLFMSSMVIKFLIAVAVTMILFSVTVIIRKTNNFSPLAMMFPLGFLFYILVLAPWRFASYLLSPLAPYVLSMFFPVYVWICCGNNVLRNLTNVFLVCLALVSFSFIALPRVSKLADIKKVEEFMVSFDKNDDMYFFPPPFSEVAAAISGFTSADVIYLEEGVLDTRKLSDVKRNYLIVNDEASVVRFDGVKASNMIYQNNTWKIFRLERAEENKDLFRVNFRENCVARVKSFLRDL